MPERAWSDDPPPWPEFTFKRMAPPAGGTTVAREGRITVQIDPNADPFKRFPAADPDYDNSPNTTTVPLPDLTGEPDVFANFWTAISPRIEDAGPGRLDAALAALPMGTALPGPRLDHMRRITDAYGRHILRHSVGTRVSPALVAAIISVESSGRAEAVSSAGATGLMQLMPATAARFGVEDRTQASENIRGGIAYLDFLAGEFDNDPMLILAGYNAGEGAVRQHGGVPPYAETRAYVPKVLAAWRVAAGLCRTPPQILSDGCVFVGG